MINERKRFWRLRIFYCLDFLFEHSFCEVCCFSYKFFPLWNKIGIAKIKAKIEPNWPTELHFSLLQGSQFKYLQELKNSLSMFHTNNEKTINLFNFSEKKNYLIGKSSFHGTSLCAWRNGILLPKNCSSDRENLLKFEAESREFAKILRSLEQFIITVKGQNNFW